MPCTTGQEYDRTDYAARRENERLTRVSCDIMRVLEANGFDLSAFGEETMNWWEQHKAEDARREAAAKAQIWRERLRDQALAKLSADERRALGL